MQTKLEKAQKWAEVNKVKAEANRLNAEAEKLRAEARKINVEADKAEKNLRYYFLTTLSLIAGAIYGGYKLFKELM